MKPRTGKWKPGKPGRPPNAARAPEPEQTEQAPPPARRPQPQQPQRSNAYQQRPQRQTEPNYDESQDAVLYTFAPVQVADDSRWCGEIRAYGDYAPRLLIWREFAAQDGTWKKAFDDQGRNYKMGTFKCPAVVLQSFAAESDRVPPF